MHITVTYVWVYCGLSQSRNKSKSQIALIAQRKLFCNVKMVLKEGSGR